MATEQRITDRSNPAKYFNQSPHIDHDDLNESEFYLLHHYKKLCGLNGVYTWKESLLETAEACDWGIDKTRAVRLSLHEKGVIVLIDVPGMITEVELVDRWPENIFRYSNQRPLGKIPTPRENTEGGTRENAEGSEEKNRHIRIKESNSITNPQNSGSSKTSQPKTKGASSARSKSPSKPATTTPKRTTEDRNKMFESLMLHLFKIAPHETDRRKAQGSLVGMFVSALLEVAPDISPKRFEEYAIWIGSRTDYMENMKDKRKFQSNYSDFLRDNPMRQWVEGKIVDDVNYRKLRRPPYRKFEDGKFWMKATLLNDTQWEVDPDPIID